MRKKEMPKLKLRRDFECAGLYQYVDPLTGNYANVRSFGRGSWGVSFRDKDRNPICGQKPGDEIRTWSRKCAIDIAEKTLP